LKHSLRKIRFRTRFVRLSAYT